ncbi:MAG: hypothetical protein AAGJ82_02515, partial [Bacteroidota bacterium]
MISVKKVVFDTTKLNINGIDYSYEYKIMKRREYPGLRAFIQKNYSFIGRFKDAGDGTPNDLYRMEDDIVACLRPHTVILYSSFDGYESTQKIMELSANEEVPYYKILDKRYPLPSIIRTKDGRTINFLTYDLKRSTINIIDTKPHSEIRKFSIWKDKDSTYWLRRGYSNQLLAFVSMVDAE